MNAATPLEDGLGDQPLGGLNGYVNPRAGWQEVETLGQVAELLGVGSDPEQRRACRAFLEEWTKFNPGMIERRPERPDPEIARAIVRIPFAEYPTAVFVNVGGLTRAGAAFGVAVFWAVSTGGAGTPTEILHAAMRAAFKVVNAVRHLPDEEAEVAHNILHLSKGDAYKSPLPYVTISRTFADADLDLDLVLASLEKKGVLSRSEAGIKLVW